MTEKSFNFGVTIYYKIQDEVKYERRFSDLEGFLDENYDGEHHMLWDNKEECWVHLDEALELMEKEYCSLAEENEQLKHDATVLIQANQDYRGENEQLKTQLVSINRLIDNKIDEFRNGDYGDLPCSTIHMFLDLKQELGDLE